MNSADAKREYQKVVQDLKSRGTYAGEVEFSPEGEWLGMVYEKNYAYSDFREQVHYAKLVYNGSALLK
ncbi:hypothetical protein L3Q72_21765 [Vibrio sp. JC009]|uniref:hypothetical protein n=1 Tax=Vibrio sp. JC009 TaxID=2912314 RepID=UPI0023B120C1|nr:hypothetical protein [Vibrio sp. JC009]WED23863.1 hypothetical protein L3Q72_21765 [Vibrio sp. JC009]